MSATYRTELDPLNLKGLVPAPSQILGSVRLLPLLRHHPLDDLRIGFRDYVDDNVVLVKLNARPWDDSLVNGIYVPYGLVIETGPDGEPVAPLRTGLSGSDALTLDKKIPVRYLQKIVRRETGNRFRMLPLHTALDGFLANYFSGPDVAWKSLTDRFLRHGLDPRMERFLPGRAIHGLEEALRLFEIHDRQVGVLLFVNEVLASVFITSHPDDYRHLHKALLEDYYGNLFMHLFAFAGETHRLSLDGSRAHSLADLESLLVDARDEQARFEIRQAAGLLGRGVSGRSIRETYRYRLFQFATGFDERYEQHIGEMICRDDGQLAYMKTFRLDREQVRRANLLERLAAHDWSPHHLAGTMGLEMKALKKRFTAVGLGWLFKDDPDRPR